MYACTLTMLHYGFNIAVYAVIIIYYSGYILLYSMMLCTCITVLQLLNLNNTGTGTRLKVPSTYRELMMCSHRELSFGVS